jgi:hypothetical protein
MLMKSLEEIVKAIFYFAFTILFFAFVNGDTSGDRSPATHYPLKHRLLSRLVAGGRTFSQILRIRTIVSTTSLQPTKQLLPPNPAS